MMFFLTMTSSFRIGDEEGGKTESKTCRKIEVDPLVGDDGTNGDLWRVAVEKAVQIVFECHEQGKVSENIEEWFGIEGELWEVEGQEHLYTISCPAKVLRVGDVHFMMDDMASLKVMDNRG